MHDSAHPIFMAPTTPDLADDDPLASPVNPPALRDLLHRDWTDIQHAMCGLVIGRAGVYPALAGGGRKEAAARAAHEPDTLYRGGERLALWCPRCQRRYDGHTPNSLLKQVRRQRCDVLAVPY
jgi:hypothetical protein